MTTHIQPQQLTQRSSASRLMSVDILRGLVMLLMLLDHVRETFFLHQQVSDPMLLEQTGSALFWSRFAAHFCAPVFIFLTGLSAWLYQQKSQDPYALRTFLFRRGAFLIVLELSLVSFAWSGQFPPATWYLQVIWVIGLCMILLGALYRLPLMMLALIAVLSIAGQHWLSRLIMLSGSEWQYVWTVLLQRGYLPDVAGIHIRVSYPLLPWVGVILLGYLCGPWFAPAVSAAKRARLLRLAGFAAVLSFVLLRSWNGYGDASPRQEDAQNWHALMSFFNLTKYPPSLNFVLLTLGVACLLLPVLERYQQRLSGLAVFGGVPMFYYLLHLYLLLILQKLALLCWGANHGARFGVSSVGQLWLITVVLIPVLYFPCQYFLRYKRQSHRAWVKYL